LGTIFSLFFLLFFPRHKIFSQKGGEYFLGTSKRANSGAVEGSGKLASHAFTQQQRARGKTR
jgi:hypothetical protein